MLMSPKRRTRVATARPDSSRNARSISDCSDMNVRWLFVVLERADFDGPAARHGRLLGPRECGIQIIDLDDPEPAELFLALGVRTVGRDDLAVLLLDDGRGVGRVQAATEHPRTRLHH